MILASCKTSQGKCVKYDYVAARVAASRQEYYEMRSKLTKTLLVHRSPNLYRYK